MKILVINCGSSSFKYQVLNMETSTALCSGLVERIGDAVGNITHKVIATDKKFTEERPFPNHTAGLEQVMSLLVDKEWGVIADLHEIAAVGHRTVQGGEALQESCLVTDEVKKLIIELAPLAPLHNPSNLQGIEVAQKLLPFAPSVAVFDTEFHATMPPKAYRYAIPQKYYDAFKVRRYGFHGTSHRFVAEEAAKLLNKPLDSFNCITCHLGNGCSISAVKNGKCVDTSMGLTPLAGVVMGTRCGDMDPAVLTYIGKAEGKSFDEVDAILNKQSGLKGICGSNDMRDIHAMTAKGDSNARLAVEMFCYSIKKYIGAYFAALGRVDAVIFTAGIGENDNIARAGICEGMGVFGIELDLAKNDKRTPFARIISKEDAKTPVLVVPTNEELAIARATMDVVSRSK